MMHEVVCHLPKVKKEKTHLLVQLLFTHCFMRNREEVGKFQALLRKTIR